MNTTIVAAFVTAIGGIVAAVASYLFTKQRELDAEIKRQRLEYYKDFVANLSNLVANNSNVESLDLFRASIKTYLNLPE